MSPRKKLVIRRATEEDVAAIHAIEVESFGDPWSVGSFRSTLAHPQVVAKVAERAGKVIGYSIAWIVGDEAELANLAIDRAARRTGVGAALLDDLLVTLDGQAAVTVYLEVREGNAAARALYESRGFVETGRRKGYYRNPDEDALVMRRG
ncbi:MAG: ribosomal protein S18-alanine N-acetyltransferase [Gemmatimonadaceae bacterium]